jgi:hypothetical protein
MGDHDDGLATALARDTRRRGTRVLALMGLLLLGVGIGVLVLGVTYKHPAPAEQLATKSVPHGAE